MAIMVDFFSYCIWPNEGCSFGRYDSYNNFYIYVFYRAHLSLVGAQVYNCLRVWRGVRVQGFRGRDVRQIVMMTMHLAEREHLYYYVCNEPLILAGNVSEMRVRWLMWSSRSEMFLI